MHIVQSLGGLRNTSAIIVSPLRSQSEDLTAVGHNLVLTQLSD
jgi:hypothetical protein